MEPLFESWQERWAKRKVKYRMDPTQALIWDHFHIPQTYWYNPRTQAIYRTDNTRVWSHMPVHDPAWWWT